MVLDTGATNTTIDSNALYLLGHDLKDNIGTVFSGESLLPAFAWQDSPNYEAK